jgi:hypothetical protein
VPPAAPALSLRGGCHPAGGDPSPPQLTPPRGDAHDGEPRPGPSSIRAHPGGDRHQTTRRAAAGGPGCVGARGGHLRAARPQGAPADSLRAARGPFTYWSLTARTFGQSRPPAAGGANPGQHARRGGFTPITGPARRQPWRPRSAQNLTPLRNSFLIVTPITAGRRAEGQRRERQRFKAARFCAQGVLGTHKLHLSPIPFRPRRSINPSKLCQLC